MKVQWLDRALITGPYLALVTSPKEFRAAMRHCKISKKQSGCWLKTDTATATLHYFNNDKGQMCCIVAVNADGLAGVQVAALLVHEAVHIWQQYRARICEDSPSIEFEAYAIQSVSQILMEAYFGRSGKSKQNWL